MTRSSGLIATRHGARGMGAVRAASVIGCLVTAVIAGLVGSAGAAGASPGPDAPLAARARTAGVSILSRESFVTHTHTRVTVTRDGVAVPVPAEIGIDEVNRRIAALHTHDGSGIVHVESPLEGDVYRLGQFLTLWGMGTSKSQVCRRLAQSATCTLQVTSTNSRGEGLKTRLADNGRVQLDIITGGDRLGGRGSSGGVMAAVA